MITLRKSPKYPYVFINSDTELSPMLVRTLDIETSFIVQNVDFVLRARAKKAKETGQPLEPWDGRVRLMNRSKSGSYYVPVGLTTKVKKVLKWSDIVPNEDILFSESGETISIPWKGPKLYPHQIDAFVEAMTAERAIINLPTGSGKCHGRGTKILMYDGKIKNVEDVVVGDRLMGPDSTHRTVLSLARGVDEMYKITPVRGEPWVCNKDHVLSLKATSDEPPWKKNQLINISVNEYLKQTNWFKHIMKQWRTGVSFSHKPVDLDPYILGVWLGDGTKLLPSITNSDPEIVSKIEKYVEKNGLNLRKEQGKNTITYHILRKKDIENKTFGNVYKNGQKENPFLDFIRKCVVQGEKRIPFEYLTNSEETRYSLLAGLLDSDGYLQHNTYEIITKYCGLCEDILFLSRSLGLHAAYSIKIGRIKSLRFEGKYYRIVISGNTHKIPCIVKRKIATTRKQKKDVLKTGFTVEPVGIGEYYGFELDGDGLYLLGDFTVTHNTVVGIRIISALQKPTLIIVHRKELMQQWKKAIKEYTGANATIFDDKKKEFGTVTIAMVQSLFNYLKKNKLPIFDVLVVDEIHHLPSDTFYSVSMKCDAKYRFGLTATTTREDGTDIYMEAGIGPICISVSADDMIKQKHLALPKFEFIEVPASAYSRYADFRDEYKFGITLNDTRNKAIAARLKQLVKEGRQVYVHVEQIDHGKILSELSGFPFVYSKTKTRDEDIEMFRTGETRAIISTLLGEGVDIPNIGAIIMAGGRKTKIGTIQKIGRALRPGKEKDAVIVDFVDKGNHLSRHSVARYNTYCEVYGEYVKNFKRATV